MKKTMVVVAALSGVLIAGMPAGAASGPKPKANMIGINVLLKQDVSQGILSELGLYGKVRDVMYPIRALTLQAPADKLILIQKLPYVESAAPDAERNGAPVDTVAADDFADGISTWDLDAVNVTEAAPSRRVVSYDGSGVFVAVLDTGLLDSWRQYFPQERIAVEYAASFGGGGGENGNVSEQPNKWEHDQNSHGTHVTSTILGYQQPTRRVNGVAPLATVIPVKVLNQNGSGWSSVIARGILYVAELKAGPLAGSPVVINMSLGGPVLDAVERAAIDHATSVGVVIVASAGNAGAAGMGYPGAYGPVISVGASGWIGEWTSPTWWRSNVDESAAVSEFYIAPFSSRARSGQDLDVVAPGSWIVGPYQVNSGQLSWYFLGGTSMAAPHVAGIAALMLQKAPGLNAGQVEALLETAAIPMPAGCQNVLAGPAGPVLNVCWGNNATGAGFITADAALALLP